MSIFDTLEADALQLSQTWLEKDWRGYFVAHPHPNKYKQAWLANKIIDLEKEIEDLKKTKKGLADTLKSIKKGEVEKAKENKEITEEMANFLNEWIKAQKS